MDEVTRNLQSLVQESNEKKQALDLCAGNSKSFLFPARQGKVCNLSDYSGVVDYEPNELVITVKSGTPLIEMEALLKDHGQMLAFEPPHYGPTASIGGTTACNLSGPRRPYSGALRDFVLGMQLINGAGDVLNLGGRVIKNVAGYDASRLMCGAYGHLGIILQISFKVLPIPMHSHTIRKSMQMDEAVWTMTQIQNRSWPVSACCYNDKYLYIRLDTHEDAVKDIAVQLGAELYENNDFWKQLKEQELDFFRPRPGHSLWRISCSPAYSHIHHISQHCLIDWGGALRWFWCEDEQSQHIERITQETGIHAMQFRGQQKFIFPPLGPLQGLHKRLKSAFDENNIFNPGKAYVF